MPLDPEKVAECRAWLGRAWADLDSAGILLGADRPRPDTALFHLSAVLARPLVPPLVILGDLTIHGVPIRVDSL